MPLIEARAAAMSLATLVVGCAAPAGVDGGPVDAGHDAGAVDAGWDGGRVDAGSRDAGFDAGLDAGPRDGGPDDPGWVRLPGLPDDCAIERAEHPERIWTMEWQPCSTPDGLVVPGCVATPPTGANITDAHHDGADVWLELLASDSARGGRVVGLGPVDGPAWAAWREPAFVDDDGIVCLVSAHRAAGGRAAFVASLSDFNDESRSRAWLYLDTAAAIGRATEPVHVFPAGFLSGGRQVAELWISSDLLALQTSPDGTLYTYRDGEWDTLTGRGTVEGLPQNVALIGDHLLWEAWRGLDDVRLVHARWGEASALWRDVTPGVTKSFGTDGLDLAWMEGYDRREDGSYARLELWTAPFADLAAIEPRFVRAMELRVGAAVGGGWYAMRRITEGPQRVEVFSLRDGTRRTFVAPGGSVVEEPYYASERDIMFRGGGAQSIRFDPTLLPIDG